MTIKGDRASAKVHTTAANQQASDDTVALVKEGEGWKIGALPAQAWPLPVANGSDGVARIHPACQVYGAATEGRRTTALCRAAPAAAAPRCAVSAARCRDATRRLSVTPAAPPPQQLHEPVAPARPRASCRRWRSRANARRSTRPTGRSMPYRSRWRAACGRTLNRRVGERSSVDRHRAVDGWPGEHRDRRGRPGRQDRAARAVDAHPAGGDRARRAQERVPGGAVVARADGDEEAPRAQSLVRAPTPAAVSL